MRILTSHEENFVAGGLISNSGNNQQNSNISKPGEAIVGNVDNGTKSGDTVNSGHVRNSRGKVASFWSWSWHGQIHIP